MRRTRMISLISKDVLGYAVTGCDLRATLLT